MTPCRLEWVALNYRRREKKVINAPKKGGKKEAGKVAGKGDNKNKQGKVRRGKKEEEGCREQGKEAGEGRGSRGRELCVPSKDALPDLIAKVLTAKRAAGADSNGSSVGGGSWRRGTIRVNFSASL